MKSLMSAFWALFIPCYASALSGAKMQYWEQDIDFYKEKVKTKHISPFHTLPEAEFDAQIDKLKKDLPLLSEVEVETRLMGITASIGDGHSNYFMMSGPHKHYPFRLKFFADKLIIIASSKNYRDLVGSELVSINGIDVSALYKLLGSYLPGVDNRYSQTVRFEFYLTLEKLLRGLGVVIDSQPAQFATRRGSIITNTHVSPVSMQAFSEVVHTFSVKTPKLDFQNINLAGIQLAFINNDTAYFRFTQYPKYEDVMAQCDALKSRLTNSKATKLIIDFRGNSGGSFYTGLAFSSCLQSLPQFDWLAGTALLTDGHTFSAAMSNVLQFRQIFNAKIIGEPTGGDPNTFSESYRFALPNSGRQLSLSVRYYPFIDEETDAVYPDVLVNTRWDDFQNGTDKVLLKALQVVGSAVSRVVSK
ncbi:MULTISPECIES: peptidase S41 [Pseudoalteromonas]|uniref:Peptidase S41 n=1 Tax=Pseudoalteromonas amylolytica TaxID=1859457 RepID=A0A1S1MKU6_9GAMM|nr:MULTISPECIES: peptidase S41 [Pseudoalteromonas]OHU85798.1 peptidase S41 [Pseudoalteromonas sp. JW3]OHU87300.1 peptidase S41 [Pseudoalteromonas amylolytica]